MIQTTYTQITHLEINTYSVFITKTRYNSTQNNIINWEVVTLCVIEYSMIGVNLLASFACIVIITSYRMLKEEFK